MKRFLRHVIYGRGYSLDGDKLLNELPQQRARIAKLEKEAEFDLFLELPTKLEPPKKTPFQWATTFYKQTADASNELAVRWDAEAAVETLESYTSGEERKRYRDLKRQHAPELLPMFHTVNIERDLAGLDAVRDGMARPTAMQLQVFDEGQQAG